MQAQPRDGLTPILEVLWGLMQDIQRLDARLATGEVTEHASPHLTQLRKQRDGAMQQVTQQHDILAKQGLGAPFFTFFLRPLPVMATNTSDTNPRNAAAASAGAVTSNVF